jgi:peptide/nickel transport system ATP-binding protein
VPNPFLRRPLAELQGEVANPAHPPEGCYFHPRCAYALPHCKAAMPELREVAPGHQVRCHRAGELSLQGTGGLATGPTNMPS